MECGETWAACARNTAPIKNRPSQAKTIEALERLSTLILDPVIEVFGSIELTYGFSGRELSNRVKRKVGRVAPELDQHAAHEENSKGKMICPRGGAAVDFRVPGRSSLELARWVVRHAPYDRLYFYGDQLPIHVSSALDPIGQIVVMTSNDSGQRVPCIRSKSWFLE